MGGFLLVFLEEKWRVDLMERIGKKKKGLGGVEGDGKM